MGIDIVSIFNPPVDKGKEIDNIIKERQEHKCQLLDNSSLEITVESGSEGTWLWCFWGKDRPEGNVILYCPYCGVQLKRV